MKVLVVYNTQGNILFTQANVTDSYNLIMADVADTKEVVGVDVNNKKLITVDKLATTEEKQALEAELEAKNKELEEKNTELLKTQAELAQTMYDSLINK